MKLPQLHLRDLFWLTVVVAFGCAWWIERRSLVTRIDELNSIVERDQQIKLAKLELATEQAARLKTKVGLGAKPRQP